MIFDLLDNGEPSHAAIIIPQGPTLTYAQMQSEVAELAKSLNGFGLGKGDRIAMALTNGLEVVASFLAASTVGTAAPLNPAYTRDEFKFYLEDTSARAMIVPRDGADEARAAAAETKIAVIDCEIDDRGRVRFSTEASLHDPHDDTNNEDDIALILHTSGTTSRPKRVPLAHQNLLTSARNVARTYQLTPADVSLCVMPLFHVHGLVASTLATFATGGTVVVPPKFNPLSFWSTVREHRATWYSAVPTIHQVLVSRSKGTRPAGAEQLRFIRSCSASLAPQLMSDLEASFGTPVLEAYGMTEAAHQMASNPLPPAARKPGSVGCGTNVEIAIGAFGAAMIASLWAYQGWSNLPMVAGEIEKPERNIPRALIYGMLLVIVVYLVTNAAFFYALPFNEVLTANSTAYRDALPVASKAAQTFWSHGAQIVSLAFMIAAIGALNGITLMNARVPYAMARNGLFFRSLADLSDRRVPARAIWFQAIWACLLALSGTFDQITTSVIFAVWLFTALVGSSLFVLRRKLPAAPRRYRALGYPVVPALFVLVAAWLVVNSLSATPVESAAGLILMALGLPFYIYFRVAHREHHHVEPV